MNETDGMIPIGKDLERAARILHAGGLVAIPTETVYGLAANALNPDGVAAVFEAKQRPAFDPLIVHVDHMDRIKEYAANVPAPLAKLAEAFWPGPLTLLLKRKPIIPDLTTAGLSRVGIRVPDHPLTLTLLRHLAFPLAAPSANPFGYISPTLPEHVASSFTHQVDYILDGGPCRLGLESTVVGMENDRPEVLRLGSITLEQLESVTGPVKVREHSSSAPHAPGQLTQHYAPRKKVILMQHPDDVELTDPANTGALMFQHGLRGIPTENQFVLSKNGRLTEAASRFFAGMRQLDAMNIDIIVAQLLPEQGLGRAMNDRLKRAAAS